MALEMAWRIANSWNHTKHQTTVDLSNATSSLNGDADVEVGKSLSTEEENGLNSLHLHTLGLHDVDGLTVQLHDSVSVLAVSDGNSGLLHREISKSSLKCKYDQLISYLTAEGLHRGLSLFRGHIYSTLYYNKRLEKLEMGHIEGSRELYMDWICCSFSVFFVNTTSKVKWLMKKVEKADYNL